MKTISSDIESKLRRLVTDTALLDSLLNEIGGADQKGQTGLEANIHSQFLDESSVRNRQRNTNVGHSILMGDYFQDSCGIKISDSIIVGDKQFVMSDVVYATDSEIVGDYAFNDSNSGIFVNCRISGKQAMAFTHNYTFINCIFDLEPMNVEDPDSPRMMNSTRTRLGKTDKFMSGNILINCQGSDRTPNIFEDIAHNSIVSIYQNVPEDIVNSITSKIADIIPLASYDAARQMRLGCRDNIPEEYRLKILNKWDAKNKYGKALSELLQAAENDDPSVIFKYVSEGYDINACRFKMEAAIHRAAKYGSVEFMKALLDVPEVDVNLKYNGAYKHPLDIAKEGEHSEIVKLLKEKGAISWHDDPNGLMGAPKLSYNGVTIVNESGKSAELPSSIKVNPMLVS